MLGPPSRPRGGCDISRLVPLPYWTLVCGVAFIIILALLVAYPVPVSPREASHEGVINDVHFLSMDSQVVISTAEPPTARFSAARGDGNTLIHNDDWGHDAMLRLIHARDSMMELAFSALKKTNGRDDDPTLHFLQFDTKAVLSCPSGRPMQRLGEAGDGGKMLCDVDQLHAPCLIFSLGSKGQYDFELGALSQTPCQIHTFDCTYDGASQGVRHTYHKLCIGSKLKVANDPMFVTIGQAVALAGRDRLDLLKIDIEMYELDVIGGWSEQTPNLPDQIAIELHSFMGYEDKLPMLAGAGNLRLAHVALIMSKMHAMGYMVANVEPNPLYKWASELTLLRVEDTSRRVYH